MKKVNIIYWIFTGLLLALMLMSGIQNLLSTEASVKLIATELKYPAYFIPFIGLAKTLGAIAMLIPGYPRIKEWIYAGFTFDMTAALYSTIAMGTPFAMWWPMILFFVILAASYIYYYKRLNAYSPATVK